MNTAAVMAENWKHLASVYRSERDQALIRAEAAEAELREAKELFKSELRAVGAGQWRPLSELPPADPEFREHSLPVLVWDGHGLQLGVAQYPSPLMGQPLTRWRDSVGWDIDGATHWMPLPEGPRQ